jgi:hypothetical protein
MTKKNETFLEAMRRIKPEEILFVVVRKKNDIGCHVWIDGTAIEQPYIVNTVLKALQLYGAITLYPLLADVTLPKKEK